MVLKYLYDLIIGLFETIGAIVVASFFLYIIFPNWFWVITAHLAKVISYVFKGAGRYYVARDIQGRIGLATKGLEADHEILPPTVKIQWVEGADLESFIKNEDVIVRMSPKKHSEHNLALAASYYVSGGLLKSSRPYMAKRLVRGSELILTHKLLQNINSLALEYFIREIFSAEIESDSSLDEVISKIRAIDESGLFIPLFLAEMGSMGQRLFGSIPSNNMKKETRTFLNFLHNLAVEFNERSNSERRAILDFHGRYIRVHVIIFASHTTYEAHGLSPYVERCLRITRDRQPCSIYVCAFSNRHKDLKFVVDRICELDGFKKDGSISSSRSRNMFSAARIIYRSE